VTIKLRLFSACMLMAQAENLFQEARNMEQAAHRRRRRATEVFSRNQIDDEIIENLRRGQREQSPNE
jgi:hypothetical protein